MKQAKVLAVIPSRYDATRLPGKPLADIHGKPMIQHVYEAVLRAKSIDTVAVATDDERVMEAVKAFGGQSYMTSRDHISGTSRVAEVASLAAFADFGYVLNVQGDEPLLDPRSLDELVSGLTNDGVQSATLCYAVCDEAALASPACVKVVRGLSGDALYFSRSTIPFMRNRTGLAVYGHIGIYGFEKNFLKAFAALPQTPLAEAESLEQLKILENGYRMRVIETTFPPRGPSVDTPEDLECVRRILAAG